MPAQVLKYRISRHTRISCSGKLKGLRSDRMHRKFLCAMGLIPHTATEQIQLSLCSNCLCGKHAMGMIAIVEGWDLDGTVIIAPKMPNKLPFSGTIMLKAVFSSRREWQWIDRFLTCVIIHLNEMEMDISLTSHINPCGSHRHTQDEWH